MSSTIRFGDYFRQRRKALGLSLREFSRRNGFDQGNVSKLERNILAPPRSARLLESYAKALKLETGSSEWEILFRLALKEGTERLPKPPRSRRISTWVRAVTLEQWAARIDAQYVFPLLVRRLVRATVDSADLIRVLFPALEGVQSPGWDGFVEATRDNEFVPAGLSVWEMSVNQRPQKKAEEDFKKRVANSQGADKKQSTFIFVTLRKWQGKDAWCSEKRNLNIWKDVRVYDSQNLEQWLETAKGVDFWLARALGHRPEAAIDLEGYWETLSISTNPALPAEVFLTSRAQAVEQLMEWLGSSPSVLAFESSSPVDVIDFIAACYDCIKNPKYPLELKVDPQEMAARTLIVGDKEAWRDISASPNHLLLIPEPDLPVDVAMITEAVRQGNHVLLCSHRFSTGLTRLHYLPRPERYELKKALMASGFTEQKASEHARQSGGSLTVLKRTISRFPATKLPEWSQPSNSRELIPFILVGAWDETSVTDQRVIEKLSNKPYEENAIIINRWLNEIDSPVLRVQTNCSLVSREDSWRLLASYITQQDLHTFEELAVDVLSEVDSRHDLPAEEQPYAVFHDSELKYSAQIRLGICETLTLLACRSGNGTMQSDIKPEGKAEQIVGRLLNEETSWQLWASLSGLLPKLVEAAPKVFLSTVENDLKCESPVLKELFINSDAPLPFAFSAYEGLLDALEVLAWNPSYLTRVSLILGRLYEIDSQGQRSCSPLSSLQQVFLPWHPHTAASVEQRVIVIKKLVKKIPKAAWELLLSLMPNILRTSTGTRMPAWRDWSMTWEDAPAYAGYWQQISACADYLIDMAGNDIERWSQLLDKVDHLPAATQQQLLDRLEQWNLAEVDSVVRNKIMESTRKQLNKHRDPDKKRSIPPDIVNRLETLQKRFEPVDLVARRLWLFASYPDGYMNLGTSSQQPEEAIYQIRAEALQEIYEDGGIKEILKLARESERPDIVSNVYVKSALYNDTDDVIPVLLSSENKREKEFAAGVVSTLFEQNGWGWVRGLSLRGWRPEQSGLCLSVLPFGRETWTWVEKLNAEAEAVYWEFGSEVVLHGSKEDVEFAVTKFIHYGHPLKAIHVLNMALYEGCEIDPDMVVKTLETLETALKGQNLISPEQVTESDVKYKIQELFKYLQERCSDTDKSRLTELEWFYLEFLDEYSGLSPVTLEKSLQQDPVYFCRLIRMVYHPDKMAEDNRQALTEQDKARAHQAYVLLNQWKMIPGMNNDGLINEQELMDWVRIAREKCEESGHLEVCDERIGEVLAQEPEGNDEWPSNPIRDVIDEIDSDALARGFRVGIYNKNGSVPFEGEGLRENELAGKYHRFANQCEMEWPKTAASLRRVAKDYEEEAKREDGPSGNWG